MHGVSLSIGSSEPLNFDYLGKLKKLASEIHPVWISDHLCWTGIAGLNTHDLLPMPLTDEALAHVVERIKIVQDFLERPLILENPSTYLEFEASTIDDWTFLGQMAEESDCGLLLDVNNIYVCSRNHGWDAKNYIQSLPADRIVQFHLAGHEDEGTHVVDTHNQPVIEQVWELYHQAYQHTGGASTLLEWDADIPPFQTLMDEVSKARHFMKENKTPLSPSPSLKPNQPLQKKPATPHPLHYITTE